MAAKRDRFDLLLQAWAVQRRELMGIRHPLTAREYIGALRCTLAARRDLHAGATSNGRIEQHWPEYPYTGELYVVNMAVRRMPATLAEICDWHWTMELPRDKRLRAGLMGISPDMYWRRVARAKEFVAGAIAIYESNATLSGQESAINGTRATAAGS